MKKLLIFPFNGNGLEALDCINDQFEFLGFIDDTKEKQNTKSSDYRIFSREALEKYKEAQVLAVPGSPFSYLERTKVIRGLNINTDRYATLIHPSAVISSNAKIGFNILIMAGVVITSNAEIGNHICILPNSVIHHDSKIGDYTLIGSNVNIAGHTTIGINCYIGSGSNIIDNIKVGDRTLVGLGSTLLRSTPEDSKIAGNPARFI